MEETKVTPLHEAAGNLENLLGLISNEGEGSNGAFDAIASVLSLDEDQFGLIAPGIAQSFSQSVNNPTDKIALTQAINVSGMKAEDLTESFTGICEEIEKLNLSVQKRDFLKNLIGTIVTAVNDTEGISKRLVPTAFELCNENAKLPQYAHTSDSGADVFALEDITVKPGETVLVPTGLKVAIPVGYEIEVRPKSGRCVKTKLRIANTPGTIDQEYRDEIKVIIENIEPRIKDITVDEDGKVTSILYGGDYTIGKCEKFAQLVLKESPKMAIYRVDKVSEITEGDRNGGFGSSSIYDKSDNRYGTDLL